MILLVIQALTLIAIILLALFENKKSDISSEQIVNMTFFGLGAAIMIFTALKMKEAEKWAWVSAIIIFVFSLGGIFFPFAIAALAILFRKNIVAYFTQPHIPPHQHVNQAVRDNA
jgi:Flp pilus assembly protein protease CpaA